MRPFFKSLSIAAMMMTLPLLGHAEDACHQVQVNLKKADIAAKSSSENLVSYQANIQEMNNYSSGSVMKTIGWTIETTFLFSAKETKTLVKNFFGKRLSVNQNFQLSAEKIVVQKMNPNLSVDQNLANITASFKTQSEVIATLAQNQTTSKGQAVQKEIDDLTRSANFAAEGNIRKFGEVAKNISDQEVYLAHLKAVQDLNQSHAAHLAELNKAKCQ